MQTNINNLYDITKVIESDFKRTIWKMDTSHFSILQKFLVNSNGEKIALNKVGDNRYKFTNPDIAKNHNDPGFAAGTITQYIRILIFYGVIDYKEIINLDCKSWKCVLNEMLEGNINLTSFSEQPEEYLVKNINAISESILEQVSSTNDLIKNEAIKILSTMEVFINYKNSEYARDLKISNFNKFINEYPFKISILRLNGDFEGYIDEIKNWMKMFDYCEELLKIILGETSKEEENELFGQVDFSGYGYLGEYIVDLYLSQMAMKHEWVSIKEKYAPFDFRTEDSYIEVKTPTTKRKKISFNLSWNEYIEHQSKKDNYKILYVDGVYNIDIKWIMRNGIRDIVSFMDENDIKIHQLGYSEIREYRFSSKGYWVTEK